MKGVVVARPQTSTQLSICCRFVDTLGLLHVDDALLVVDKPAGLLSVPGRGEGALNNLTVQVQRRFADALVVHRLDQATSGLMLLARGPVAQRALSMAFEARRVDKRYIAVVHGDVEGEEGCIDVPLGADWPQRPRQQVDLLNGKPAQTLWRVVARKGHTTRLALQPITGRSHQLRVHLQSIGHPIVGDLLYARDQPAHERLLLHACQLRLAHPSTGALLQFDSEAPF